jgi:hypothetical protein
MTEKPPTKELLLKSKRSREELVDMYLSQVQAHAAMEKKSNKMTEKYREMEGQQEKYARCINRERELREEKDLKIEKLEKEIVQLKRTQTSAK